MNINKQFVTACFIGDFDLAKSTIEQGANDWANGISRACYNGHPEVVKLILMNTCNVNVLCRGFSAACSGGRCDCAELLISKGACNYETGFFNACYGNHINIVKLLISKNKLSIYKHAYFRRALEQNKYSIARLFISKKTTEIIIMIIQKDPLYHLMKYGSLKIPNWILRQLRTLV